LEHARQSTVTLPLTAPVTLTDSAVLSSGFNPTGTIVFTLTGPGGFSFSHTDTVSGVGTYTANTALPTTAAAGTYTWTVRYGGDANNAGANDQGGRDEQTVVGAATLSLVTEASPDVVLPAGPPGTVTLSDAAFLSDGSNPTGSLVFTLTGPNSFAFTQTVTVSGDGTYTASTPLPTPPTGTVVGTFTWTAHYSGDGNNLPVSDQGGTAEQTLVRPAIPTLVTTADPATVTLPAPVPTTLTDSADLEGGFNPTGSMVFTLTGPNGVVFTDTVPVSGNGTYAASTPLPTSGVVAGTYTWSVTYEGDANNDRASDQGGRAEQTVVALASPTIVTTASPSTAPLGTTLEDSADLTGGFDPAGSITFRLYVPGVHPTVGPSVHTETVTVNGDGTYHTIVGFVANAPGTWHWVAMYNGDPNNTPASSGPLDEPVTIPPQPEADLAVTKTASNPTPAFDDVVTFTFVIRNNGPDPATDVVVSDPFPPGLVFVAVVSIDQGAYDPATGLWQVGTLPVDATATLKIAARVTAVGTVENEAVVSGAEFDPDLSNNRSTAVLTVPPPVPSKRSLLAPIPPDPVATAPARIEAPAVRGSGVPGRIAVGAGASTRRWSGCSTRRPGPSGSGSTPTPRVSVAE
jgi:uncharacterized repeat protein (TIGR01451 family)